MHWHSARYLPFSTRGNRVGNILYINALQARHAHAPVTSHVDMMGSSQLVCMLGRKSWPLHGRRSVFGQDSLDIAYDIVDGFREVFDILTRDTGHADTPIGQHAH